MVYTTPRPYNPNPLKMARMIKQDLEKINIKVNILTNTNMNKTEWKKEMLNLGMVLTGWVADNPDPDNFLRPNLSCADIPSGMNLSNWCNQEFELLLTEAITTQDPVMRKEFYVRLQQIIRDRLPIIPLAHGTYFSPKGLANDLQTV